jgi:hypothetical protein
MIGNISLARRGSSCNSRTLGLPGGHADIHFLKALGGTARW